MKIVVFISSENEISWISPKHLLDQNAWLNFCIILDFTVKKSHQSKSTCSESIVQSTSSQLTNFQRKLKNCVSAQIQIKEHSHLDCGVLMLGIISGTNYNHLQPKFAAKTVANEK